MHQGKTRGADAAGQPDARPSPAWRALARALNVRAKYWLDHRFDVRFGVNTAGNIPAASLRLDSASAEYAVGYQPMSSAILRKILRSIDIGAHPLFIDFGSGKGRALLVASEFPFEQIRGVEYSWMLHKIAQTNIGRYRNKRQRCTDIASICEDAVEFELPPEPSVLLFFSPFYGPVLEKVVERIRESVEAQPRRMVIVSYGLWELSREAFESLGWEKQDIAVPWDLRAGKKFRATVYSHAP